MLIQEIAMMKKCLLFCAALLCLLVFFASADKGSSSNLLLAEELQETDGNMELLILAPSGIGSARKLYTAMEADWTSTDPDTVTALDGMITAVSPGTAVIQAHAKTTGELLRSVQVTVREMNTFSLPGSLTEIDSQALSGTDAERILLPDSIQSIDPDAFVNCPNLLVLYIPFHALPNALHIGEQTVIYINGSGIPFNGYIGIGHVI